jgi:hypothetical protein
LRRASGSRAGKIGQCRRPRSGKAAKRRVERSRLADVGKGGHDKEVGRIA